jgi:hypothetical protein
MGTVRADMWIRLGSEDPLTAQLLKDDGVTPIGNLSGKIIDWIFLLSGSEAKRFSTADASPKVSVTDAANSKVKLSQLKTDFPEVAEYEQYWIIYGTDTTTITAQAIGTGDAVETVFSLGCFHILPTTDVIKLDGAPQTRGVDYTIDNQTGIITFTSAPGNGVAITADFQYYKPHPLPDSGENYRFDVKV